MSVYQVVRSIRQKWMLRYPAALLVVALVTLLRIPLAPLLGNSVPFILYFPGVVIVGWFGGFGAGLFATLVSGYCARTWFFEPYGSFAIPDVPSAFRLGLFLLSGVLISFLCGRLHRRSDELEAEKAQLEVKVKSRTRDLERALGDMESFAYTVSHDLRSPLRTMQGFAEVLVEDHGPNLDPAAKAHLERICGGAVRMNRLIDDLLAFAQVSGAQIELQPTDLKPAVTAVVENAPHLKPPTAEIVYDDCTHRVLAHGTLLHQALQNLIENGVKFVQPGVRPQIRIWSELSDGMVRVWVADNGIGISSEHQKRLFRVFERLGATSYSGTGIGLAIVDRAISKMQGRVGVESEVGKGSRFWFELAPA
jgi:signal transduction histidine kinase